MSSDSMSPDEAMKTLKMLSRVVQNDLQRASVLKVLQAVCTSHFLDTHLVSLIQKLPSYLQFGSQSKVVETVEFIQQLVSEVCRKLPSYSSRCFLLLTLLASTPGIVVELERSKPSLADGLTKLTEECQSCMTMLYDEGQSKESRARFRRGPNADDDLPPDDFAQLPVFPSAQDMDWTEQIFLR